MTNELLALALTVLVHILGMGVLVWALLSDRDDERPDWRGWFGGFDDEPPEPQPGPGGGGLPLDVARPSAVRLREPGRLAGGYPQAPRRPRHDPQRAPHRTPTTRG